MLPVLYDDLWTKIFLQINDKSDGILSLQKARMVCKKWNNILNQGKYYFIFNILNK